MKKKKVTKQNEGSENEQFPLPFYPEKEDIYNKDKEIQLDDPEEKPLNKSLAIGLDVPGSELDDTDEEIGEEDEENNYYSIGGDRHNDLDEDKEEDR